MPYDNGQEFCATSAGLNKGEVLSVNMLYSSLPLVYLAFQRGSLLWPSLPR